MKMFLRNNLSKSVKKNIHWIALLLKLIKRTTVWAPKSEQNVTYATAIENSDLLDESPISTDREQCTPPSLY